MAKKKKFTDGASYVDENGVRSNSLLHQQLTEGVDETELDKQASQIMQDELGLTKEEADEMCGVQSIAPPSQNTPPRVKVRGISKPLPPKKRRK